MRKCVWYNKENEQIKEIMVLTKTGFSAKLNEKNYFICPEHENKFRKFMNQVARHALVFLGLIAICISGLILSCIYSNNYWSAHLFVGSFASIGLVLILFPFCTPETISMFGVAKSIKLARIIGGTILALGITGFILGFLYG